MRLIESNFYFNQKEPIEKSKVTFFVEITRLRDLDFGYLAF